MPKRIQFIIGFLSILGLIALIAPIITAEAPDQIHLEITLSPPSIHHPFGTDHLGRDLFSRIVYGSRISLSVGFIAVLIAFTIGIIYGGLSGYIGGKLDQFLMKVVNIMLALPTIFIILSIQVIFKPSIINVMIVIGLTSWMGLARLVRAEFLSIKKRLYILRSRAYGFSSIKIMAKDILPNAMIPILVSLTLSMASAILTESTLSFLGLGVQPPYPSWGNMLNDAQEYLYDAWWLAIIPGLFILFTVLAFNYLGEYLQTHFQRHTE